MESKRLNEKGLGLIGVLILIVFIIATVLVIYFNIKSKVQEEDKSTIASDMLLIQGACKLVNDNASVSKKNDEYVGTKLSKYTTSENNVENEADNSNNDENKNEFTQENTEENNELSASENNADNENKEKEVDENGINPEIIKKFLSKNVITENLDKYYILTDSDLQKLKIDVKNQKDGYYIINYETNDVYTTKDVNGKYNINDIK